MYLLFAVEMPSVLLMAAIRNVHIVIPSVTIALCFGLLS